MEYELRACTISGGDVNELVFGQDEEYPNCVALKLAIGEKILMLHDLGISDFFTNCEYGLPFYAAEAVLAAQKTAPSTHCNPPRKPSY
jgi:hypothetical protein